MRKTTSPKLDLYTRVTDKILADLAQGVRPWLKPWNADNTVGRISRPLRANGTPYRGINVLLLWGATLENGYRNPTWLTFKQADALSAHVRKGEKGSLVVYADTFRKTETNEATGEETEKEVPFLKSYTVFNVEQIEGLPPAYYVTGEQPTEPEAGRDARLEAFFKGTGAVVRHGGNRAYYTPVTDHVQMPPFAAFEDGEAYCSTLAHETVHMTGHPSRLDRNFGAKRWGDEAYALEELVAELGAAFLCADLGITPEVREDHAAYIGSWLQALKDDRRCIFTAAAHAQRAVDFLLATQAPGAVDSETTAPVDVAA